MLKPGRLESLSFHLVMGTLAGATLLMLIGPTLVVLVTSLTNSFSLKFPPPGYSVRWYVALIDAWQIQNAALNSLKVAACSTAISVVLGTAAALAIARSRSGLARLLDGRFMSPLLLAPLAFGLAAPMFFSLIGIPLSFTTLVIGHTVVGVPFVLRTANASLQQINAALWESSASLGAGRFY